MPPEEPAFSGFPPEALRFLRALKRNNRREWFQPRKEIYERQVKAPMLELAGAVVHRMRDFAPDYVRDPAAAIYRVYRDTRFSPDKTPYKTHVAAVFNRRGLDRHAGAGLYFSVSPEEIEVAGGVYMPSPEDLRARALREKLGELQGDRLTRVPKGFPADHPAADLVQAKQWLFWAMLDPGLAASPRLLDEIVVRFRAMTPVVDFLNAPLGGKRAAFPGYTFGG
jgi:uncharacterized protein (TIGR02453 family)